MEDKLLQTLAKLSERMKWVIIIGTFLVTGLMGGYAYQITVNMTHAETIQSAQQSIQSHLEAVNPIHELMIEKWINK